jgi:hypothetical protein
VRKRFLLACLLVAISLLLVGCLRWAGTDSSAVFRWRGVPSPNFYVGLAFWSALGAWGYWKLKSKGCLVTAAIMVCFMIAYAVFASTFVLDSEGISHTGFLKNETVRWADVQVVKSFESSETKVTHWSSGGDTQDGWSEKHIGVFSRNGQELRVPVDSHEYHAWPPVEWLMGYGPAYSSAYDQEQLKRAILKRLPADVRARSMSPLEQDGVPDPGHM